MTQLSELIRLAVDEGAAKQHVAMPGIVQSYDYATQRASVLPSLKKAYRDGRVESQPVIPSVPVLWPRTKTASLTLPLEPGDSVLLIFCDRAMENWLSDGGEVEPGDPRKHDLTDAFAIPGCYSFATPGPADNAEDVVLRLETVEVRLQPGGKLAMGAGDNELLDILADFMQAFISALTTVESEALTTQPAVATLLTKLNAIKGTL